MMGFAAAGAVVSAWLVGSLAVAALWPRDRALRQDLGLVLPLGLGFGLGITSALFFAASLVVGPPRLVCVALELSVAGLAAMWIVRRRGRPPAPSAKPMAAPGLWPVVVASLFVQATILAIAAAVRAYQLEPYSNSDGWVIWNMHARFLFRGGTAWPELLRASQITWTHPDYPLLVPASVARAWAYVGYDAPSVAGLISALFGLATVALLVAAVARRRNPVVALVGGLVLLGTPFFVTFSSNQHADIPLAFYILAAVTLIALRAEDSRDAGMSALLGAAAGFAAWTKNEGILFVLIVGLIGVGSDLKRRSWRQALAVVAGATVALLPVAYFKLSLSPANDLVASDPWARISHLYDWSRHRLILSSLWRDLGRFGEWAIAPFGVMVLPLLGRGWRRIRAREWTVLLVLALTLAGYYAVYLLTPWELSAHLDSSLVRLLMQLWPSAVFFWCLAVTYPSGEFPAAPQPIAARARRWPLVAAANLVIAAGSLTLLNRQLAANELAAANVGGTRVHVLLGEGWYGRETLGPERWAWSKGESTLLMRVDGTEPRIARLRFTLRSLGARTVTATVAGRVVWRANVSDGAEAVQLPPLTLAPGKTALLLQTDAPGVPESPAAGARALTYAVYNPEVIQ